MTLAYLLSVVLVVYICGRYLITNKFKVNILFWTGILFSVSGLLFFKYFNFVSENIHNIACIIGWNYPLYVLNILIPIGLSFYTFQSISYLIEIKNKNLNPEMNLFVFSNYLMFFPKVASGPIEEPKAFLNQIRKTKIFDYNNFSDGVKIAVWGFFKKMVIADRLAVYSNEVFNNLNDYKGLTLILAFLFFSFQLYADFSGYIDIAIGIGLMFGYKLTDNFRQPYLATSVKDFWRRWHITLSNWVKKYIFLPSAYKLAKNKISLFGYKIRQDYLGFSAGTIIAFFVIGLWHGAKWNFVIWGLIHAFFLLFAFFTRKDRKKCYKYFPGYIISTLKVLFTFLLITFAWIFFRINNLSDITIIINNLVFDIIPHDYLSLNFVNIKNYSAFHFTIVLMGILVLIISDIINNKISFLKFIKRKPLIIRWLFYYMIFFSILYFKTNSFNFLYVQF